MSGNDHSVPVTAARHAGEIDELIEELEAIRREMTERWTDLQPQAARISSGNERSARNLVHYLSLRRDDVRHLQGKLAGLGFSSLGRSEPFVLCNVAAVLRLLHRLAGRPYHSVDQERDAIDLETGREILRERTRRLLGSAPINRRVRIMVTLPSEAADDYGLVRDFLTNGMDCARINCAHDDPDAWRRMAENVRRAEKEIGRSCRICIDLAGPKLRTGSLEPGPRLIQWKPDRDVFGRPTAPALIWLGPPGSSDPSRLERSGRLHFPDDFINGLGPGTKIKFRDTRDSRRTLVVRERAGEGWIAECADTAYVSPEIEFHKDGADGSPVRAIDIPPLAQFILLRQGDTVVLTAEPCGRPAVVGEDGSVVSSARIACTLPEVFQFLKVGEPIWFDDGAIGGIIREVSEREVTIEVSEAGPKGQKLKADKGINVPDSELGLPSLTDKDLEDLAFAAGVADIIGYSFVRSAADVHLLQDKLRGFGREDIGVMLKIETKSGFSHLPEILLASMRSEVVGIMIARGDLAVELGFERMAEVQEEILWMCEAAHLPVIWATQVLEQLSKKGLRSRAEITDAAMSERAECVMLNKGPFAVEAVRVLDDILTRMQAHQDKKRSMLRPLKLAERFFADQGHGAPGREGGDH